MEIEAQKEYYRILTQNLSNQSNYLDTSLLTLSSGAIGLIVTVLKQSNSELQSYLLVSSILFMITVLLVLSSGFCSIKAHEIVLKKLCKAPIDIETVGETNWNLATAFLTNLSFLSFFFAAIFLLLNYL